jgi:hypothetical protein
VLDIDATKKGSGLPFGLRSSEKQLPERRSGAFSQKNTPVCLIKKSYETTGLEVNCARTYIHAYISTYCVCAQISVTPGFVYT